MAEITLTKALFLGGFGTWLSIGSIKKIKFDILLYQTPVKNVKLFANYRRTLKKVDKR